MGRITLTTPITFNDALPKVVDVAIIGGGIAGVSTALCLAEQGLRVAIFEKGRIAGEQSSRNWGWVRQLGRDPAELPLMREAAALWQGMAARIGADVGYQRQGVIYLAHSEAEMARQQIYIDLAAAQDIHVDRLDAEGVAQMITGHAGKWPGGVRCAGDGRAEPWIAVPAMARAAQGRGAVITENCAVRGLAKTAGRISGVITERGMVQASAVLLAGGAWASLFLQRHGITFPQLLVRATVARTAPAPDIFAGCAADDKLAFRRRADGGYTLALADREDFYLGPNAFRFLRPFRKVARASWRGLGVKIAAPKGFPDGWGTARQWADDAVSPFEKMRVLDPSPAPGATDRMRGLMAERLPALKDIEIAESWAGMIDVTPDIVPALGPVPGQDGLWIAAGFSGHGFGIGPAIGRIMADMMQGRPAGHDLSRFRFARFADGSPIDLGPSL